MFNFSVFCTFVTVTTSQDVSDFVNYQFYGFARTKNASEKNASGKVLTNMRKKSKKNESNEKFIKVINTCSLLKAIGREYNLSVLYTSIKTDICLFLTLSLFVASLMFIFLFVSDLLVFACNFFS